MQTLSSKGWRMSFRPLGEISHVAAPQIAPKGCHDTTVVRLRGIFIFCLGRGNYICPLFTCARGRTRDFSWGRNDKRNWGQNWGQELGSGMSIEFYANAFK